MLGGNRRATSLGEWPTFTETSRESLGRPSCSARTPLFNQQSEDQCCFDYDSDNHCIDCVWGYVSDNQSGKVALVRDLMYGEKLRRVE